MFPLAEAYEISAQTANAIETARRRGERVIAVGTTVVRALEDAAAYHGRVRAGFASATLRVGARTRLQVVDALVTGQHEPGTSHYELLRAFQDDSVLRQMTAEAEMHGYRMHEFGDSLFIARRKASAKGDTADSAVRPVQLSRDPDRDRDRRVSGAIAARCAARSLHPQRHE
jgi:S-adenosylmethionine:tRNA ribosyltransferase-isomerase